MAISAIRQDLLQALSQVQNHPAFAHVDIMTITGCGMTDDEVCAHLDHNIEYIARFNLRQIDEALAKPAKRRNRKH